MGSLHYVEGGRDPERLVLPSFNPFEKSDVSQDSGLGGREFLLRALSYFVSHDNVQDGDKSPFLEEDGIGAREEEEKKCL